MISANQRLQSSWPRERRQQPFSMPTFSEVTDSARSAFDSCPVSMTFAAFGLGVTLGVALSLMFQEDHKRSRTWSW